MDDLSPDPKPEIMKLLNTLCNLLNQNNLHTQDTEYAYGLALRIKSLVILAEMQTW